MVSAMKTKRIKKFRGYCLGKMVIDLLSKEKTNVQRSDFFRLVTSVKSISTKLSFGVVTSIGNILYLNVLVKIRLIIQLLFLEFLKIKYIRVTMFKKVYGFQVYTILFNELFNSCERKELHKI